jgi:hypothetical protein
MPHSVGKCEVKSLRRSRPAGGGEGAAPDENDGLRYTRFRRYDLVMTKAELHRQIDAMTDEEAAEARLIYAADWPSKVTSIDEVRRRLGTKPMSSEDFDRHFGRHPPTARGRALNAGGVRASRSGWTRSS